MKRCIRCGWEWEAKVENPAQCPKCHSPLWNKERRVGRQGGGAGGVARAVETVMVEKEGVAAKREPAVRHIESGKVPAVERELDYADSQEWRPRRKG